MKSFEFENGSTVSQNKLLQNDRLKMILGKGGLKKLVLKILITYYGNIGNIC